MPLSLVQAASVSYLRSQPTLPKPSSSSGLLLQKSIFPDSTKLTPFHGIFRSTKKKPSNGSPRASLLETPVLWAGRICVFYALVRAGLAGSKSNPIVSGQCCCCCFVKWFQLSSISFDLLLLDRSLGLESGGVDVEDDGSAAVDLGFSKWIQNIKGKPGFSFNTFCVQVLNFISIIIYDPFQMQRWVQSMVQ